MERRALLAGLPASFLVASTRAWAGEPGVVVVLKAGTAKGPIAPYEEAARGFKEVLQPKAEVLVAPGFTDAAVASVALEKPDLLVAFGTEAAQLAEHHFPAVPRVVALAPGIAPAPAGAAAPTAVISPDIAADVQVRWIADVLPDVKAVGVLFDPEASRTRFDELGAAAIRNGGAARRLTFVPIPVASEGDVPAAFKKASRSIHALLFVPDRTITRGTISYLLKETLSANIPAIGFNGYFVDNGAVLGIKLDYEAIGRQAADAARGLSVQRQSFVAAPKKVEIWVNARVADKLRIRTDYDPAKVKEIR